MYELYPAPSVVVGVDGSPAARDAAVWAIDEAVSRDVPLRLVCVVDSADLQLGAARTALRDAQRMVESTGKPVKIETEIARGMPFTELHRLSCSAVLVGVGSLGLKHAREGGSSVAAALAASAHCPVAVVCHPPGPHSGEGGYIVADVEAPEPDAVLRCAFEEARLRDAPLRVVTSCRAEASGDSCPAHAHLDRRVAQWIRLYPDVQAETVTIRDTIAGYLADNADAVQLAVTGSSGVLRAGRHGRRVMTVRGNHL